MSAQQNIVQRDDATPPTSASETAAVIQMIERAARDPSVDLDKMERLMRMRKEMLAEEAERQFNLAMRAAQAEMRPISADAENKQTHSVYATYAKLDSVLRPIYTKHGFSISYDETDSPKTDHIRVLAYVSHDAGHTRTYRKDMPADGKGAKGGDVMTKTHAAGAAASYGARYLLKGIWNVAVGEDDADGNEAVEAVTDDQAQMLRSAMDEAGADVRKFCEYFGIASLSDLPASKYQRAMQALAKKRAQS